MGSQIPRSRWSTRLACDQMPTEPSTPTTRDVAEQAACEAPGRCPMSGAALYADAFSWSSPDRHGCHPTAGPNLIIRHI
jgi:hypothetical protein